MIAQDLIAFLPELTLFFGAMALLMYGVYASGDTSRMVNLGAITTLVVATLMVLLNTGQDMTLFNGALQIDGFTILMKVLTLLAVAVALFMSQGYMEKEKIARFEFPVLVLLAACGMAIMISANDMIALYMGLELQSLALYVVAAINRESGRSTEAGLKYFVLGALSSGMLLYGISLIYGFTGTVNFADLALIVPDGSMAAQMGLVFGLVFMLAGLAFKISAVPFHMWTPDVYEGAPTPVTAFFAAAPKLAAMALMMRAIIITFPQSVDIWLQIVIFMSLASMGLGAFAAIGQNNIKRLMAYSSIGHIGFALVGFAAVGHEGVTGVIAYMILYVIMSLGTFACILSMRNSEGVIEQISGLSGLSRSQPLMAFCMAAFMFSLAGIPPLAGFFGKFYVFRAAMNAELYFLAVFGVLASVVGAYYYLRVVKIMYLDEPHDDAIVTMPSNLRLVSLVSAAILILFFVYPSPLVSISKMAAAALLGDTVLLGGVAELH
ncbi:MAG: NADH-quinone oxidoreductase subunit NuoN [Parvibaculales bacterium]